MTERPIRRKERALPEEEARRLLETGTYGVLAVTGDEGWPYAVPMNYIVMNGAIYLHCAREGHKIDAIRADDRVCFTVTTKDELVPDHITTMYESVVVFGRAAILEDDKERIAALETLVDRLGNVTPEIKEKYIHRKQAKTALIRIDPVRITGKANRSFIPVTKRM